MKRTILRDVVRTSAEKLTSHQQFHYYPHFSFIIQDNKVLGMGMNNGAEPPRHFGYHDRLTVGNGLPKIHAEFAAYRKVKGILRPEGFEIVNIRMNRLGQLKTSAPCSCCFNFLSDMGCTHCYFSTDTGEFATLKMT